MGGAPSMLYSGAMEGAGELLFLNGLSRLYSLLFGKGEMQEELDLDVTLHDLQQKVTWVRFAIKQAERKRITDRGLLNFLASLMKLVDAGNYFIQKLTNQNSCHPMIGSEGMSNSLVLSEHHRPRKRQRIIGSWVRGGDDHELKQINVILQKLKITDLRALLDILKEHPERPVRTYIYMNPEMLVYMDEEMEYVVKFLLEPSRTTANNVDILPIVGDFAVGKTSLVAQCFHKSNVQNHFSKKNYLYIGHLENDRGSIIIQQILMEWHDFPKETFSRDISEEEMRTLVAMLKQKLKSERFLLVIDGVWDIRPQWWNLLLECFRCGKQGSKVILITNTHIYAKCPNIVKAGLEAPLTLTWFSEEEYSFFFDEHAFGGFDPEDFPELTPIGREIKKKMKRSILGAKVFGEVLRNNFKEDFWSMFLQCLSDSDFRRQELHYVDFTSVTAIMSRFLTKCLGGRNAIMSGFAKPKRVFESCRSSDLMSFGQLMALGGANWTPIITNYETHYELPFLATKNFDAEAREYNCGLVGYCQLTNDGTEIQPCESRWSVYDPRW